MRLSIDVHLDYYFPEPADVLLQVEAAAMADQRLIEQSMIVHSDNPIRAVPGEDGIGQRCWIAAHDRVLVDYKAVVEIDRQPVALDQFGATPVRALAADLTAYLLPSRYCEVDRFDGFVRKRFAGLDGGALAAALVEWVYTHLTYDIRASGGDTRALDVFAARHGVCRDFAHLLVALARAGGIPARCVSAYAPGVDPPDFHAVAELWLDGAWHLADATGMAAREDIARVCVGRDATDIAFMTIFGRADLWAQRVTVTRIP
ncbi:Transglutaminase [Sphingomonas sp. EC-HK361]|uniref:transglutaminase-like domain-containing protein n=1 Tax=Sphingomonas sp. EC-HK361 TaxID=2038397 RepID=UPI00125A55D8|nr:transglutaminase family protein [Sphingomonas sp. EC-HK361]VVT08580.1 Transglutaminase [Sphingomonas sp. EC-HK361]